MPSTCLPGCQSHAGLPVPAMQGPITCGSTACPPARSGLSSCLPEPSAPAASLPQVLVETSDFDGDVADLESLDLKEDLQGDLVLARRLQVGVTATGTVLLFYCYRWSGGGRDMADAGVAGAGTQAACGAWVGLLAVLGMCVDRAMPSPCCPPPSPCHKTCHRRPPHLHMQRFAGVLPTALTQPITLP